VGDMGRGEEVAGVIIILFWCGTYRNGITWYICCIGWGGGPFFYVFQELGNYSRWTMKGGLSGAIAQSRETTKQNAYLSLTKKGVIVRTG